MLGKFQDYNSKMSYEPDEHRRVVITERPETDQKIKPTTEARKSLYDLIVRFRQSATNSDDTPTKKVFQLAADVLARLVRLFKRHEDQQGASDKNEPTQGPT